MENLSKKQKIVFIGMFVIMIITILYYFMQREDETEIIISSENTISEENVEEQEIIIHIAGCVEQEGIVKLTKGSRIADAIEKAGGLTSDANINNINLAYELKDGQKLYIPSNIDEEYILAQEGEEFDYEAKEDGKININTATQTELEELSGIGPSTALKIIEYRNENGEFSSIEEIKNVSGIGEAKYEAIQDSICVD